MWNLTAQGARLVDAECGQPELDPRQRFRNAEIRIKAGLGGGIDSSVDQLRGEAADQVKKGWPDSSFP